ncbi:MAG: GAF domain-containing protein, partial [Anaerolineae bacterium]
LQRLDAATGLVVATYDEKDGLPNNVVYSVLPDGEGHLWLSTNLGLSEFDPRTETFQNYTASDGLQSNEFNLWAMLRAPDGELLFGGVNGINAFYPEEIGPNPYVPPLVITEILLGPPEPPRVPGLSRSAPVGGGAAALPETAPNFTEEIELSYRDRVLSFEFAALHFAIPERNQYAYVMEGFDRDWNYVGNRRFATYTNLPPGRYVFRVKGSNSDGVWNEDGASLAVRVTPPFWATWWFRGGLGLLLVGVALGGYRLRVRGIRTRSRELEVQVTSRTRELAALNAIAEVVSRSLERDEMLENALDETLAVMAIEAGGIYLLDGSADILRLAVQRGFSPDAVTEIDRLPPGEGFSGRVVQSGEPLVVADVSRDPRLTRMVVQEKGLRSLAVAPLSAKGKVLGTLFVITSGVRTFSDEDVELLTSIGRQIGMAVENAGLYEDTRSRLAQLTALQETTTAVAGTLELERLLNLIVHDAVSLLQAEGGILNLVDWDNREDEVVAAVGVAAGFEAMRRASLDESLSGWVTLHNQAVASNSVRSDGRISHAALAWLESESGKQIRNTAAVPLRIKDEVVGTLVLVDKQAGNVDFDQSDLNLLQAFANQAATAIENARLFEAEQRRAEQFRVISEVGRRTTSILSIDELLNQIIRLIYDAFEYDIVEIGLVEGDELVFKAGLDRGSESPVGGYRLLVGEEGITGHVAATGRSLVVPDVRQDDRFMRFTPMGAQTGSEVAVPIKTKEKTVGVLNVQSLELDAFDKSDLAVLQALADQAAIAIENARLFEAEQRRAEQFRVISEVGRRITSIISIESVLEQVVELIQDAFAYDHVGIAMIEGGVARYRVGAGKLWEAGDFDFSPASLKTGEEGVTGWVAGTGEPMLVPDVREEPNYVWMRGSSTVSELAVPMKLKGEVVGVLDAQSDQLDAFDESDLIVLQALADQAAIAVENARLYERAQRLAVVEERQRLARELHDSVTQGLYGVTLYAEATARQLGAGQVELASDHLRELRETAQEALREMRLLIFELRPSILESEGLVNALRARVEAVEERAGLEVDFRVEGETVLPTTVEEGLYRIAQEALNNALKHACAQRVSVSLERGREQVVLEVIDDGCGFDPDTAVEGGGLGLDGMIERAGYMGGRLELDSGPNSGTRVCVEVPL